MINLNLKTTQDSLFSRRVRKIVKIRKEKVGIPPGTPIFVGRRKLDKVKIQLIDYDENQLFEKVLNDIEEAIPFKNKPTVTWLNISGLHEINILESLEKHFNLHPLLLEDILNTDQRPKLDDYESHLYIALKLLEYDDEKEHLLIDQISLILGSNYVISFLEEEETIFQPVKERIKNKKGKIRNYEAGYLFYSLIDIIIDNYFLVLEKISDKIEVLEDEVVRTPTIETLHTIHSLKTNLIFLRKSVWPLREVISRLERTESELISSEVPKYIRDIYDHVIQIIDTVETLRDIVSGMLDIYLSSVSNKMNEVMKVLTIIATIVIPMTVISGIYGMNFQFMPELSWPLGYPFALSLMILVAIIMITYFWRKKWF